MYSKSYLSYFPFCFCSLLFLFVLGVGLAMVNSWELVKHIGYLTTLESSDNAKILLFIKVFKSCPMGKRKGRWKMEEWSDRNILGMIKAKQL